MAKHAKQWERRAKARAAAMLPSAPAPKRRLIEEAKPEHSGRKPARSRVMQLAAEVERLERALADARKEVASLAARADVDPLTDLVNRRGFERELARACAYVKRYGTSVALVYLDLDRFKNINDSHGHAAGDAMLKAVALVLARHVRASDLVGRLGGDEFAVLLWNCGEADAQVKTIMLEAAIARTTASHAGASLSVGASAGATLLLPLDQPAAVLERADCAMYARKAWRRGEATPE
jgi:diguanylate cyclase (GGDEF)-like protein